MGQRINIQYSVDMDDLVDEVGRLLQEAHTQYHGVWAGEDTWAGLTNETIEKVDHIRQELTAVDHRLNDVVNIISGYLYYKAQEMNPAPGPEEAPQTNGDLESHLEEFKSLMQGGNNEVSDQGK
jgi:hypothetical protein